MACGEKMHMHEKMRCLYFLNKCIISEISGGRLNPNISLRLVIILECWDRLMQLFQLWIKVFCSRLTIILPQILLNLG